MKDRFCTRAHFRDSSPARIATTSRTIATLAFANEIDISVLSRPSASAFENHPGTLANRGPAVPRILQREGKSVVNADQGQGRLGETFNEPLGNCLACPISTESRRRRDFACFVRRIRCIHAQALEAGVAGFRPRIVDPDIPLKRGFHFFGQTLLPYRKDVPSLTQQPASMNLGRLLVVGRFGRAKPKVGIVSQ